MREFQSTVSSSFGIREAMRQNRARAIGIISTVKKKTIRSIKMGSVAHAEHPLV
jgi:hypothetical protein